MQESASRHMIRARSSVASHELSPLAHFLGLNYLIEARASRFRREELLALEFGLPFLDLEDSHELPLGKSRGTIEAYSRELPTAMYLFISALALSILPDSQRMWNNPMDASSDFGASSVARLKLCTACLSRPSRQ